MAEPAYAPVGNFCWTELASGDLGASKAFFAGLLGWGAEDVPSAMGAYTLFKLDGLDVAASTAKAKELGGTVYVEPKDIENVGRFAVLQEPGGAVFHLFKLAHPV